VSASSPKTRLYVEHDLAQGQTIALPKDQAHYLMTVMRLSVGDHVTVFNGRDGAWLAQIASGNKRNADLAVIARTAAQGAPADLWLLFAPIKKTRTDFIVEKAAELGVARICPVQTAHTNSERIRQDRLQAHALEAAEQCEATYVAQVDDLKPLSQIMRDWPEGRRLFFADEATAHEEVQIQPQVERPSLPAGPAAILIGPEGGFSHQERTDLRALPFCHRLNLGPRILRADTAAVAAITLWQSQVGDWRA
jgi:16S rRNA (uracil1498-N3)-methyltransferase